MVLGLECRCSYCRIRECIYFIEVTLRLAIDVEYCFVHVWNKRLL